MVLGIFNAALEWDIFSPKLETFLYGVFGASIALGAFGVAITIVLGIQEIVKVMESLNPNLRLDSEVAPKASKIVYVIYMVGLATVLAALIGVLSLVNHRILIHRSGVFKRIAAEHTQKREHKFFQQLAQFTTPPRNNVPETLHDLIVNVNKLSFVNGMTVQYFSVQYGGR